jgi:hypothetical protein
MYRTYPAFMKTLECAQERNAGRANATQLNALHLSWTDAEYALNEIQGNRRPRAEWLPLEEKANSAWRRYMVAKHGVNWRQQILGEE